MKMEVCHFSYHITFQKKSDSIKLLSKHVEPKIGFTSKQTLEGKSVVE